MCAVARLKGLAAAQEHIHEVVGTKEEFSSGASMAPPPRGSH